MPEKVLATSAIAPPALMANANATNIMTRQEGLVAHVFATRHKSTKSK